MFGLDNAGKQESKQGGDDGSHVVLLIVLIRRDVIPTTISLIS